MKHVSILIPDGAASISNVDGAYMLLTEVNSFRKAMGEDPLFHIQLVGISKETSIRNGVFTIAPEALITNIKKTDLIIIPAIQENQKQVIEKNKAFVPWIVDQHKNGAEIASFCVGAFFLASTGLLNGKQCATHWASANDFRSMFPDVNLVDDKIMTEEDGIYTSGGAYSFLNLLLYLIEKYAGRDMAIKSSKVFMIDIDRDSQSPFIMFRGQKEHEDGPVKQAQEFIEKNYHDRITIEQLTSMLALSRRNFERRFKKATSNTVVEYIQRVKVEAAKMSLESSRENVNEVMYKVGYSDNKAFRNTFKRITGLSPIQYRNKYQRA